MSPDGQGDGCYAAVTSAKPIQPAQSAHNPPQAHNLGKWTMEP